MPSVLKLSALMSETTGIVIRNWSINACCNSRVIIGDSDYTDTGGVKSGLLFLQLNYLAHAVRAPVKGTASDNGGAIDPCELIDQRYAAALVGRLQPRKMRIYCRAWVEVVVV